MPDPGEGVPVVSAWRELRRRGPDPLLAAALSAIWPGLGHFGHRTNRALLLINATLAITVAGLAYAATRSVITLLTWSVTPSVLRIFIAGVAGVLLFRVAVTVDAYRSATFRYGPRRRGIFRRLARIMTLVLVAAIMIAPHILAVRLAAAQLDLLSGVFDAAGTQTATPTPLPVTTLPTTPVAADRATEPTAPVPQTTLPVAVAPSTAAPSTPAASPTWAGVDRLTIALLGSDAGFDRAGVRTDTIIVLSIDVATGDAAAFNVPRNWRHLTFPQGTPAAEQWPDGYPEIANEIYGLGLSVPEAFPGVDDAAGHAVKSALAQLTGLEIQYYVLVGMQGFVDTIDLFGGIDMHVTESISERIKPIAPEGSPVYIVVEPGDYRFNGLTALGYVRARTGTSDYHRMTRQRCVVEAFINQITPAQVLANYLALTGIVADHVKTDIPLDRLDDLIRLQERLDTSRIVTVNFIPPEFPRGSAPVTLVRAAVTRALNGGPDPTAPSLADACRPAGNPGAGPG